MEKKALIDLLNRDLADEHAAVLRYLVHGWLEGEDTPLGSSLISISREEMWHMHWLGMIIGRLGGEPNLSPAPYPYDPTSRETILKSYIKYEENLIPHYNEEAEKVQDPHIKRVLQREAWESAIHARKFQRKLDKLTLDEAATPPAEGIERELSSKLLDQLQTETSNKYTEMLQHLRTSWLFQKEDIIGWNVMDQSMEKMKQLAHFAEDIAENGVVPDFKPGHISKNTSISEALKKALDDVQGARKRHAALLEDSELKEHSGLVINTDLTIKQEEYEEAELADWVEDR